MLVAHCIPVLLLALPAAIVPPFARPAAVVGRRGAADVAPEAAAGALVAYDPLDELVGDVNEVPPLLIDGGAVRGRQRREEILPVPLVEVYRQRLQPPLPCLYRPRLWVSQRLCSHHNHLPSQEHP